MPYSYRKQNIISHYDKLAGTRDNWIEKNSYFYSDDRNYMRFLVGPGSVFLRLAPVPAIYLLLSLLMAWELTSASK